MSYSYRSDHRRPRIIFQHLISNLNQQPPLSLSHLSSFSSVRIRSCSFPTLIIFARSTPRRRTSTPRQRTIAVPLVYFLRTYSVDGRKYHFSAFYPSSSTPSPKTSSKRILQPHAHMTDSTLPLPHAPLHPPLHLSGPSSTPSTTFPHLYVSVPRSRPRPRPDPIYSLLV